MSVILFTGGGIPACIVGGIPAYLAAGLWGVVSQHALHVSRPTPREKLRGLARGVSRPTPGGVSRPTPTEVCIPACTEADPPNGYCCWWYASYWNAFLFIWWSPSVISGGSTCPKIIKVYILFIHLTWLLILTGRNEVVAKVIFLHLSVILFTGGSASGVTPLGRRHHPEGGTPHRQGDPPQQGYPPRRPLGRRPSRQGDPPPAYGQWAAGTHPTGMHSCWTSE